MRMFETKNIIYPALLDGRGIARFFLLTVKIGTWHNGHRTDRWQITQMVITYRLRHLNPLKSLPRFH